MNTNTLPNWIHFDQDLGKYVLSSEECDCDCVDEDHDDDCSYGDDDG